MLVPAIAFAWWLVSMSPPLPPARAAADPRGPAAQAASSNQRDQQPDPDDVAGDQKVYDGSDESNDDAAGERVALKVVTTDVVRAAKVYLKELLDQPVGAERAATVNGRRYVFVLERHYHPPGFVGGPNGWHKGVTVYELK